jgi:RNA polymerase sigma-70 factor (ECF subfamily)
MSEPQEDPDVRAMSRLREGEDLALNEIMNRWQERLMSYLLRLTGNDATALDLAQETFARVYQHRDRYRPTGAFSSWLFAIATNLARHHFRWRMRHRSISIDAPSGERPPVGETLSAPDPDPGHRLEKAERANAVREAVSQLPPDLREALILFEYEEMSYEEIAKIQRCSVKAVETRLYRARGILRGKLAPWLKSG